MRRVLAPVLVRPQDLQLAPGRALTSSRHDADRSRVEMMRGYAESRGCRRAYLLGYFGEDLPEPCGNCDTCLQPVATWDGTEWAVRR